MESGFEVFPYHLDLIPGMRMVEDSLAYFEDAFKTKIHRFPHPEFVRMLDKTIFQPPQDWLILDKLQRTQIKFEDIEAEMRRIAESPGAYLARGIRAADNPIRRLVIKKHGPVNVNKRTWAPVYDWKILDLRAAMGRHKIKLPVDYELFGRSFDGINFRYIDAIRKRFPEDYERIKLWFPLIECEFKRLEFANDTN
jgi:hypothetical protein